MQIPQMKYDYGPSPPGSTIMALPPKMRTVIGMHLSTIAVRRGAQTALNLNARFPLISSAKFDQNPFIGKLRFLFCCFFVGKGVFFFGQFFVFSISRALPAFCFADSLYQEKRECQCWLSPSYTLATTARWLKTRWLSTTRWPKNISPNYTLAFCGPLASFSF